MNKNFEVTKCTPSNEGKTFVWTLVVIEKTKVFGIEKLVKRTYYIGGMPQEVKVGVKFTEDLAKFDVVEREFVSEENEKMMLKWLHVKIAA